MTQVDLLAAAAIELRITTEGECTCGVTHHTNHPPPDHTHHIECDWGRIDYSDPRPDRGEVGHLILAMGWVIGANLENGPTHMARDIDDDDRVRWQEYSVTACDDRLFLSTAWPIYSHGDGLPSEDGSERHPVGFQSWTWELFPAHFADGKGPEGVYVGRWPD